MLAGVSHFTRPASIHEYPETYFRKHFISTLLLYPGNCAASMPDKKRGMWDLTLSMNLFTSIVRGNTWAYSCIYKPNEDVLPLDQMDSFVENEMLGFSMKGITTVADRYYFRTNIAQAGSNRTNKTSFRERYHEKFPRFYETPWQVDRQVGAEYKGYWGVFLWWTGWWPNGFLGVPLNKKISTTHTRFWWIYGLRQRRIYCHDERSGTRPNARRRVVYSEGNRAGWSMQSRNKNDSCLWWEED